MFSLAGLKAAFSALLQDSLFWLFHGALVFGLTASIHVVVWLIRRRKMLEGKEVDQKIGNIGNVSVDVSGDLPTFGKTVAELAIDPGAYSKDLVAACPGALAIEAEGSIKFRVKADPVPLALMELGKIHGPFAEFVTAQIAKLRAGAPLDAHAQAAVDAHVAAAVAP
jgi:hypothetical protein